jgi:2-polyprenyl-3-methyl-5-hydroxy-6-metoxy-1,4-benzoquinol methylase
MSQVRLDPSSLPKSVRRNETPYWGEHAARYVFARRLLTRRRVLDIACGTGYGFSLIGAPGRFLVGVDLDFSAIQKARQEILNDTTVAIVADGSSLPFSDESFDAITSFETLEHLERRSQFLAELRRVLSANGLCIISTPNANHTQPVNGKPRNPFHLFEYNPEELRAELTNHFESVYLFGQDLNPRFVISPFWEDQQKLSLTPKNMLTVVVWRLLNKLPFSLRDTLSKALWGHALYPGEEDYDFDRDGIQNARVLVAVCSKSATGACL